MQFLEKISKHNKLVGGIALGIVAIVGIYVYSQFKKLYDAVYVFAGAIVHNFTLTDIDFTVLLQLENKGDFSVDVLKQDYDVYINNHKVAHIQYPTKSQTDACNLSSGAAKTACLDKLRTQIKSNAKSTIPLHIKLDPRDLLKAGYTNIMGIVADKSKVVIKIDGKFTFKAGPITMKDFPFKEELTLDQIMNPNPTAAPPLNGK